MTPFEWVSLGLGVAGTILGGVAVIKLRGPAPKSGDRLRNTGKKP